MLVNNKHFIKTVIFLGIILPGSVLSEELTVDRFSTVEQVSIDNDLIFEEFEEKTYKGCLKEAKRQFEQCKKDFGGTNPRRMVCAPEFEVNIKYCDRIYDKLGIVNLI